MHCVAERQREACLIIKRSLINSFVLNINWYLSLKPPKDKQYIKWSAVELENWFSNFY